MGSRTTKEQRARWRAKNMEKVRIYAREWTRRRMADPEFKARTNEIARRSLEKKRALNPPKPKPLPIWTKDRQREYHREWSRRNRDKIHASYARSRARNIEKVLERTRKYNSLNGREYSRRYREKNAEKRKETCLRYRLAHIEEERARQRRYGADNKPKLAERTRKRAAAKLRAIPAWADELAIQRIYRDAARQTRETGIQHDVDHIVPLQGKLVCGLHCEANLQILEHIKNVRKGNRHAA